ncbi:hypothetical protein ACFORG_09020 [Lutimaribacter marinistellae]|uniref:Lipoprotein n=1 Tax=Lutimaribacter marinistellae TaxID=1820329 RepID=A0ABV7TF07_9RHOB
MIRSLILLAFALLAACNTPSPHFSGIAATRVSVEGSTFDIRLRGNLAEAIRLTPEADARFAVIAPRAGRAMAQVSGCNILKVMGDSAVQLGVLGCDPDAGQRLLNAARIGPDYDCFETSTLSGGVDGVVYRDYECAPF